MESETTVIVSQNFRAKCTSEEYSSSVPQIYVHGLMIIRTLSAYEQNEKQRNKKVIFA